VANGVKIDVGIGVSVAMSGTVEVEVALGALDATGGRLFQTITLAINAKSAQIPNT
jgi:hypothetical protein